MSDKNTIAVLGAGGTMGFPIARNLARAGFTVRAWNRSREKAEPLTEDGAQVVDSPDEAVRGADVVLTILADADAVVDSLGRALNHHSIEDAIWVQASTIGEQGTERCIDLAREYGLGFVDAPVLGTRQPAEERKLVILASGPSELEERVRPIFEAIAQRTMWVGEAGAGTRLKIATNSRAGSRRAPRRGHVRHLLDERARWSPYLIKAGDSPFICGGSAAVWHSS